MSDPFRIMSFNVNTTMGQGPNIWTKRAPLLVNTIKRYSPDLIGLQEVSDANLVACQDHLQGYKHFAGNRYGEIPPQDRTSIFWKDSRFQLLDSGEFWFSNTPDRESTGWGVPYPMGATWIKLQCRASGLRFVHLNTHFEDGADGELSRIESAKLVVTRLHELAPDLPAVVTGDFNCNPWSEPYRIFLNHGFMDTYRAAGHADSAASSTFHDYKGKGYFALDYGDEIFWRVDWILTQDHAQTLQVTSSTIARDMEFDTYPSDHYPMITEVLSLS